MNYLTDTIITGAGATMIMDIWGLARQFLFGIPPPNYALVGRWVGHMPGGRFRHDAIGNSPPVPGERLLGWGVHYAIGILFAGILLGIWGREWIQTPTLAPALITGLATVAAPFLLMQPGMGAGIAASRTPRPGAARLQSVITHMIFGAGLYIAGWLAHYLNSF